LVTQRDLPQLESVDELSKVRLRRKEASKVGSILFDGSLLKDVFSPLKDNSEIAIEVLQNPESLLPHQLILQTRQWLPATQELGKIAEIIVEKNINIMQLKEIINQKFVPDVPLEYLRVSKCIPYYMKSKITLSTSPNWYVADDFIITGTPWYLVDGHLIIYKDDREQEIEIEGILKTKDNQSSYQLNREKGIKIYTIHDEEGKKRFNLNQEENQETTTQTTSETTQTTSETTTQTTN